MASMYYQDLDNDYLIKQNRKLRMELKQSNQLRELHQQALMQMNQKYPESKVISTLIDIVTHSSNQSKIHQLNQIIMQLEAKVIVLEKIASQTQENQKQTYNLLALEFQKLKSENDKKQDQLHKFYEKIGEVDYLSGLVTKYKEVISTTQQAMAFKKEQQQLFDALNLQQQTIKKLTDEKQKLMKINIHMKQEVQKRKDQVRNMTMILMNDYNDNNDQSNTENILDGLEGQGLNHIQTINGATQGLSSRKSIQNQSIINMSKMNISKMNITKMNNSLVHNPSVTINFMKMQRQLIKQANEQDELNSSFTNQSDLDCPELSILFPDKVQKIIKNKQELKVPYLNMKKVREMMAKRQEKMRKQWQQEKHHMNPTNKIIQLQNELDITRKQLGNQSLKFRVMSDQIKSLRFRIEQLQRRNELLVESNCKLKNNYQIIYSDYHICKSITTQIQRVLGQPISKQNEKHIKSKIGKIIDNQERQEKQEELQLTFRDQSKNNIIQQIFNFQQIFKNRSRAYSV